MAASPSGPSPKIYLTLKVFQLVKQLRQRLRTRVSSERTASEASGPAGRDDFERDALRGLERCLSSSPDGSRSRSGFRRAPRVQKRSQHRGGHTSFRAAAGREGRSRSSFGDLLGQINEDFSSSSERRLTAIAADDRLLLDRRTELRFDGCSLLELIRLLAFANGAIRTVRQAYRLAGGGGLFAGGDELDVRQELDEKFLANLEHLLRLIEGELKQAFVRKAWELQHDDAAEWRSHRRKLLSWFSEFPDNHRPVSTTWPWSIRPSLAVLWGVCWMFYYGQLEHGVNTAGLDGGNPSVPAQVFLNDSENTMQWAWQQPQQGQYLKLGREMLGQRFPRTSETFNTNSPNPGGLTNQVIGPWHSGSQSTHPSFHRSFPSRTPRSAQSHVIPIGAGSTHSGHTGSGLGQSQVSQHQALMKPPHHNESFAISSGEARPCRTGLAAATSQGWEKPLINAPRCPSAASSSYNQRFALCKPWSLGITQAAPSPRHSFDLDSLDTRGANNLDFGFAPHADEHVWPEQRDNTVPTSPLAASGPHLLTNKPAPQPPWASVTGSTVVQAPLSDEGRAAAAPYLYDTNKSRALPPQGLQATRRSLSRPAMGNTGNTPNQPAQLRSPESIQDNQAEIRRRSPSPQREPIAGQQPLPPPIQSDVTMSEKRSISPADASETDSPRIRHPYKRLEDPPRNPAGKMVCKFAECGHLVFDRKCEWSKHMDKHDRPYKCNAPGCEKLQGFTYSGGLLRHEREVHKMHGGTKKALFCPHTDCKRSSGKGFTRKENLAEHIRRVHRRTSASDAVPAGPAGIPGPALVGLPPRMDVLDGQHQPPPPGQMAERDVVLSPEVEERAVLERGEPMPTIPTAPMMAQPYPEDPSSVLGKRKRMSISQINGHVDDRPMDGRPYDGETDGLVHEVKRLRRENEIKDQRLFKLEAELQERDERLRRLEAAVAKLNAPSTTDPQLPDPVSH